MKKQTITINRYYFDDKYFIEVVREKEFVEFWIGNDMVGVKSMCFALNPKNIETDADEEEFVEMAFEDYRCEFDELYNND